MVFVPRLVHKPIAILLAAVMLAVPAFAQSFDQGMSGTQESSISVNNSNTAIAEAKMAAQENVNGGLWFLAGCLGGFIGWIIAQAVEPSPPATHLMGKSNDYVLLYTQAYKEEGKRIQSSKALAGCLTNAAFQLVFIVLINVAAASSVSNSNSY